MTTDEKLAENAAQITFHGDRFNPESPENLTRLAQRLAVLDEMERRADVPSPDRLAVRAAPL